VDRVEVEGGHTDDDVAGAEGYADDVGVAE
jgi:hypothetical protein